MREAAIGAAGQAFGSDQFSSPWGLVGSTTSGGNYRRKLLEHVLKGRDFRVLRRMSGDENYTWEESELEIIEREYEITMSQEGVTGKVQI